MLVFMLPWILVSPASNAQESAASGGQEAVSSEAAAATPAATGPTAAAAPGLAAQAVRHAHGHAHRTPAESLADRVQAMTRELGLDARQQAGIRDIFIKERIALLGLKSNGSATRDLVAEHQGIISRTRDQIRAILTEDQRRKYFVDVPQGQLGPAQVDVNYWLEQQRKPNPGKSGPTP